MENTPDKTIIEMSALTRLNDVLLRTQIVIPDLKSIDKTPSWDGDLYVYKSEDLKKCNMLGKIPVQVKGTFASKYNGSSLKFPVEVTDIRNYESDGGALFFVVQMKNFDRFKIFYSMLLPFDIKRILNKAANQNKIQIKLSQFPHRHIDGMKRILVEFLNNKRKQGVLLPNVTSLSDLKNSGIDVEKLELLISNIGLSTKEAVIDQLLHSETYIYAQDKKLHISFPVDKFRPELITQNCKGAIFVNGERLFDEFSVLHKCDERPKIQIGKGIIISNAEDSAQLSIEQKGNLKDQIKTLKFLKALLEGDDILIGTIPFGGRAYDIKGFDLESINSRLAWLQRINQVFIALHVRKDIELDKLNDSELRELDYLASGILDKEPVPFSVEGHSGVGGLTIGNIKVAIISKESNNKKLFYISDYFESSDFSISSDTPNSDKFSISPYATLDCKGLKMFDNIDYQNIAESVIKVPYSEIYGNRINFFILELLKYYDSQVNPDSIILEIIENLTDFLIKKSPELEILHRLNLLQTNKRKRQLTKEEKEFLLSIKISNASLEYKIAANILLESFQEAELIYSQLEESEKTAFSLYPIMHLWKK